MIKLQAASSSASAAAAESAASNPLEEIAQCLRGSRVLVAEDNRINASLMAAVLKKFGLAARMVANGTLAVEAAVEDRSDLVFMDVQMPELNGLEATSLIRAREDAEGIPHCYIIALTAEAMQGDAAKCLEAGMDDYLAKPLKIPELAAALAKYCSSRRDGSC